MMTKTGLGLAAALVALGLAVTPAAADESRGLSDKEFDRLFKQLHVKNQPWATIPWKISVTEARQLAAKAGKPIFMQVNQGNCLGRV
jgi:hypothetical protein